MSWPPYRFEDTPSLTRAELRRAREFGRVLPGPEAGRQIRRALGQTLQRLQRPNDGGPGPSPGATAGTGPGHSTQAAGTVPGSSTPAAAGVPSGTVAGSSTETSAGPSPDATAPPAAPRELGSVDEMVRIRHHGPVESDRWNPGAHPVRVRYRLGADDLVAVLEVPLASCRSLVGAVVEVAPERLGASDLPTAVEQGVLAFFAERLASGLCERLRFLAPWTPVSIQDIVCENAQADWGAEGPAGWYAVSGALTVAQLSLPFRLLLPRAALERARREGRWSRDETAEARLRLDRWLGVLGHSPLPLRALLGRAVVTVSDLNRLELSDILLFDPEGCEWDGEALRGRVALVHAGDGLARVEACVEPFPEPNDRTGLLLRVESVLAGPHLIRPEETFAVHDDKKTRVPGAPDPEELERTSPGAGTSAGRAAAEETPITVRIELGRLRLTLRELAQLTPGAVLELGRDPAAPVSLVVEDRVIGTGDLVRVESELGVRIASLAL